MTSTLTPSSSTRIMTCTEVDDANAATATHATQAQRTGGSSGSDTMKYTIATDDVIHAKTLVTIAHLLENEDGGNVTDVSVALLQIMATLRCYVQNDHSRYNENWSEEIRLMINVVHNQIDLFEEWLKSIEKPGE